MPPFIINNTNKHVHYEDPLSFNTTHFELLNYDTNFFIEHSERSVNRPYTNSNFTSEPSSDEHNPHILQYDTGHNISHNNQNETTELFQNQETTLFNTIPDSSETATIQNASEFSQETTNDPQSITITDDSNILQIPVHNITQTHINDHTPNDTTHNPNQDNTSILSTSNTLTTHELQPQQPMQPNYDPPPLPSQNSPLTTPYNSSQQGSSITQVTNTVQFQTISNNFKQFQTMPCYISTKYII